MGRSDDSRLRRKNKLKSRKQNDSHAVSSRIAAIIAAKKRRKTGKRRMCQGLCYSLPTPEDPFNDRHGIEETKNEKRKPKPSKMSQQKFTEEQKKRTNDRINVRKGNFEDEQMTDDVQLENSTNLRKTKANLLGKSGENASSFELQDCPSKFLVMCLNSIQNALLHERASITDEDKPFFVSSWGVEFWKGYSLGKNMVDASVACSTVEKIAWITSTAADTLARKEKEGSSIPIPSLLFLVPSKEKASMVRSVCKPLKAIGIHSVSLHAGASLEHQIEGLRSCEPEFLVSTPERLLELLSLNAVDISGISLLVADGLEAYSEGDKLQVIRSIRQHISGTPQTLAFYDGPYREIMPAVETLLSKESHLDLDLKFI